MNWRIFALLFLLAGCQKTDKTAALPEQNELPRDFELFYTRFHLDSVFQIDHIVFPLEGMPSTRDTLYSSSTNFYWQKKDWTMHRLFDDSNTMFKREYSFFADRMITEYIFAPKTGYGMERRFAKIGESWYLIYYAGMRNMVQ